MNQFSDQILARQMLEIRDRGYSFALFFRRGAKGYLQMFSIFGFALIYFGVLQFWMQFYLMLGMFIGCFFRDVAWARAMGKAWLFRLKVTDWDKIQKLADEKDVV